MDKCSNCDSTESKTFWDYKDGSMLCDNCEKQLGKDWEDRKHGSAIKLWLKTRSLKNNNSKISLFTPAGESRRFGAYLIDNVLITYGGIIIGGIIAGADSSNTILTWIGVIIIIFFWFIYELIKDGLYNGQSIGKLLAGVKVVDYSDETKPCSLIQSVKRNLTIFIPFSAIIYYLEIREHYDKRRMGDGWANTIVIMPNEKLDPKKGVQQLKSSKGAKLVKSRNISNMCDKCGKITTTNLWDLEDGSVMCNKCFTGKE